MSLEAWARQPFGAIIGTAYLVDCHRTEDIRSKRSSEQLEWGNYAPGRFAFELADAVLLPTPIPYRGLQRFFNVELP
jgi:activating signal cointegrator 1